MSKTVEEIAQDLGVSITTVRLVINDKAERYRISARTRERVRDYIDRHGYTLNQTARNLKLQRTQTLGLIVPSLTNPFFSMLTEQLEYLARLDSYQLITTCSNSDQTLEKNIARNLLARGVEGLFVASTNRDCQLSLLTEARDTPIVFIDRDFNVPGTLTVTSDNRHGAYEMTSTILGLVDEPVYFLGGDIQIPTIRDRVIGFKEAHVSHQRALAEHWLSSGQLNRAKYGHTLMAELFARLARLPSAIVCSSLPILEGALHFIRETLGHIPEDLVIGTFDDHAMLDFLPNRVISVRQHPDTIADHAGALMRTKLDSHHPGSQDSQVVKTTITLRL